MRLIVYVSLFVACWFAAIGAFRSSLLFRLLDVVPSQVHFVVDRLLCFLIVSIQASGISISLSLLMLLELKSSMDSLFDPTCVPVRVTINKLNVFPNRKMPRFVSVLRNCGGLRTSKPYISVMFFYPVLHRSPCFPDVDFAALTWNPIDDTVL